MTYKKINPKQIYLSLKKGVKYEEEVHCPMVIRVLSDPNKGTMAAFCKEAGISDSQFYRWCHKYKVFNQCYRYGCMLSLENWEEEGRQGKHDDSFNLEIWKIQGSARYGIGRSNRVRVHVDSKKTPFDQYQQLIEQASFGDFTSAELKQLMESINIGCRAYEQFELQKEIDKMRKDLTKMSQNNGNNIVSIEGTQKAN